MGSLRARLLACLLLAAGLCFLTACGGGGSADTGGLGNGAIEVQNQLGSLDYISQIYIENEFTRIGYSYDVDVGPGNSFTVNSLAPGTYFVSVTWGAGDSDSQSGVPVSNGSTTPVQFSK